MGKEVFKYRCNNCKTFFEGILGTPCPNCNSIDVSIIIKKIWDKLKKALYIL